MTAVFGFKSVVALVAVVAAIVSGVGAYLYFDDEDKATAIQEPVSQPVSDDIPHDGGDLTPVEGGIIIPPAIQEQLDANPGFGFTDGSGIRSNPDGSLDFSAP